MLRYGGFYGPGTSFSVKPEGEHVELIRKRKFPIVGSGDGVWSFIHIEDAAAATVAAIEHGDARHLQRRRRRAGAGARMAAGRRRATLGARKPMRVPRWIGRLAAGEAAIVMMTEMRGASNAKAKRELGWQPRYPSWRQGFAEGLG